jgi:hypothetical protein
MSGLETVRWDEMVEREAVAYRSPPLYHAKGWGGWGESPRSRNKTFGGACERTILDNFVVRRADVLTICVSLDRVPGAVGYFGTPRVAVCEAFGLRHAQSCRLYWWWVEIEPR